MVIFVFCKKEALVMFFCEKNYCSKVKYES